MARRMREVQQQLVFPSRGGLRSGAGRKPKGARPQVSHAARARLSTRHPLLVSTRLLPGIPSLRCPRTVALVRKALEKGSDRFGFRLVEYSVQTNHLHLLVESEDARSLARGMQGLLVRVARALNRDLRRTGKVFLDRYHASVLKSPRQVRNALVYVLQNARKHASQHRGADEFSSGPAFEGWKDLAASTQRKTAAATSWLLITGWKLWGLIDTHERPVSPVVR